ncbi:type II secretion system F family protein (plasmid) [Embleya sp. NBC_00888]|uniref:type II secretion system F family protein n=1 Tax=Embleya sp. NBC_00888 TaxID=2975960 RepID=UPI002F914496|nr:type II secretion system F family protein [Embleya sp. NBC_00888]
MNATVLLGMAAAGGLVLAVVGWRGTAVRPEAETVRPTPRWLLAVREILRHQRLVVGAVAAGIVAGVLTGWPVGGLLVTIAVLLVPRIVAPDRGARERTERIEAVAVWTEMLRDTLSAAAGLEQALRATATAPPLALAGPVRALAARIEAGERLPDALRAFADDVDDPTCDLVVTALVLAAERQARQLAALLGTLAEAAREQVVMRLKVDAERTRVHSSVRIVVATTLAMAAGLVLLNRTYLDPFDTGTGQLVLAGVGGLFGVAFAWMARIAAIPAPARLLQNPTTTPTTPTNTSAASREAMSS